MGSDAVAAGSFSIDLVAFVCAKPGDRHRVRVRDQFRIPRPGETEMKVEDSPGASVVKAHVGPADDPSHDFRFAGPGGPLSDDGLELEYTATDKTPKVPDGACVAAAAPAAKPPLLSWRMLALGAGALVVIGAIAALVLRRRR